MRFPYAPGQLQARLVPEHVADLPASSDAIDHDTAERLGIDVGRTGGFSQWTRNVIFGPDDQKRNDEDKEVWSRPVGVL